MEMSPSVESPAVRWVARLRDLGLLVALAVVVVVTAFRSPQFATAANFQRILLDISLLLIVATGETMVVLTRNIDLSVGSALGLVGITVGFYLKGHPDIPTGLILAMGIGLGTLLGSVNGLLVAWGRVPAIIATLGTLSMYRGLVFVQSGSQQVNPQDLPARLIALARPTALHVPWMVILALAIAVAALLFLRFSRTGRAMYATGSNPMAAHLRGIPTQKVVFVTYLVSGALAGLAGILYAARFATVNPASAGMGFELQVVAAVVIGGTSILGGRGSVVGTVLGALLLGTIANALAVTGVSGFWQRAIEGGIILAAVSADAVLRQHAPGRRGEHA
ncbi:ABC transporter permease [Limnochorda pilosa]|uniref:Autoinducer 2 import system permease protein LsrC n=1 Tax=Limnochorda pilosa TaxID=1555112 RepID=A0A0K2SH22_LIMPI|nr:ABC transporter permease [Limnochorda pilosa]BAS26413.1 ribose ABC transporter permease [Limnochorda pilosa]